MYLYFNFLTTVKRSNGTKKKCLNENVIFTTSACSNRNRRYCAHNTDYELKYIVCDRE